VRAVAIFLLGEIGEALALQQTHAELNIPTANQLSITTAYQDMNSANLHNASQSLLSNSALHAPLFNRSEIEELLQSVAQDQASDVQMALRVTARRLAFSGFQDVLVEQLPAQRLSTVERVIFLKGIPFFQDMTMEQLKVLAAICEETSYASNRHVFQKGDNGGTLYVIVSGQVGIEREKRKGVVVRVETLGPRAYFGEVNLFDDSRYSASAIALQDTLILQLNREPLIALARQNPDMSLKLINVLSQRLRMVNNRISELTRTQPRQLLRLFDEL
jgi:hypothetical protein